MGKREAQPDGTILCRPTLEELAEQRRQLEVESGHWFMVNRKDLKAGLESGRNHHKDIPAWEAWLCIEVKTGRAEVIGIVGKDTKGAKKGVMLHESNVTDEPVFEATERLADIAAQWGFEIRDVHFRF